MYFQVSNQEGNNNVEAKFIEMYGTTVVIVKLSI